MIGIILNLFALSAFSVFCSTSLIARVKRLVQTLGSLQTARHARRKPGERLFPVHNAW